MSAEPTVHVAARVPPALADAFREHAIARGDRSVSNALRRVMAEAVQVHNGLDPAYATGPSQRKGDAAPRVPEA